MTQRNASASLHRTAKLAGLLYLIIIVCGISSEVFIRGSLVVAGSAQETAANIVANISLYRIGFVADSVMLLSDVAIAVLFYQLLKPVHQTLALLAAAFRLTQAAVIGFNLLMYYAPVLILSATPTLEAFTLPQQQAMALLFLEIHSHGYDLGLVFFGVSCLLLGGLVVRAQYLPSLLGYGVQLAGVVYLVGSFTRFLAPSHLETVQIFYAIPLIAEVAFCVWLLVKGTQEVREA